MFKLRNLLQVQMKYDNVCAIAKACITVLATNATQTVKELLTYSGDGVALS